MTEHKNTPRPTGLALLREPFPTNQISKLPKATKQQTEALKADRRLGIRCDLCGQWHHRDTVHLDYVGHAALTHRLLDCDPEWNWEPVAVDPSGVPAFDRNGGMWIRLTVCGVTRLGYGHPDGKQGGDAIKEVIGDALRNAAMRFGAALDLWHKGDLHGAGDDEPAAEHPSEPAPQRQHPRPRGPSDAEIAHDRAVTDALVAIEGCRTRDALLSVWEKLSPDVRKDQRAKDASVAQASKFNAAPVSVVAGAQAAPIIDDSIPY